MTASQNDRSRAHGVTPICVKSRGHLLQRSPLLLSSQACSHWLLLLSIKSWGAGPSCAVCVYGLTQFSSGASMHICTHSKQYAMEQTQKWEPGWGTPEKEVWGPLCVIPLHRTGKCNICYLKTKKFSLYNSFNSFPVTYLETGMQMRRAREISQILICMLSVTV